MIYKTAFVLAAACKGNPALTTIVVAMYYLAFSSLEAIFEELITGSRFLHWADPFIVIAFIGYSALCVWACASYNTLNQDKGGQ